jgi:hypothetical protein
MDTPLPVKDESPNRITNITAWESKQFDLSITNADASITNPSDTLICAPNMGAVTIPNGTEVIFHLQLFAGNMKEVWKWKLTAAFGKGSVRVTPLTRLVFGMAETQ